MKKTVGRKSRDTLPLTLVHIPFLLQLTCFLLFPVFLHFLCLRFLFRLQALPSCPVILLPLFFLPFFCFFPFAYLNSYFLFFLSLFPYCFHFFSLSSFSLSSHWFLPHVFYLSISSFSSLSTPLPPPPSSYPSHLRLYSLFILFPFPSLYQFEH